jgi:hypothetical protein
MVSGAFRAVGLSSLSRRKGRLLSSKTIGEGVGFGFEEDAGFWLEEDAGFCPEEGAGCWPWSAETARAATAEIRKLKARDFRIKGVGAGASFPFRIVRRGADALAGSCRATFKYAGGKSRTF